MPLPLHTALNFCSLPSDCSSEQCIDSWQLPILPNQRRTKVGTALTVPRSSWETLGRTRDFVSLPPPGVFTSKSHSSAECTEAGGRHAHAHRGREANAAALGESPTVSVGAERGAARASALTSTELGCCQNECGSCGTSPSSGS